MAQNEVNIRFRITSDGSLKMIGQQARSAAAATEDLAGARNRYSRGEKGVSQATSNSTKSFSKMRDSITGSGGLVAAYATLAANVFALSAVFLTLRRAAEVDQLRKGLSELGTVSGLAMETLARGLVEATGNALSLEEAMRATAQVTSSGLDPSSLEEFGKAAKNISITLGRDVSDSFDRLTRGVTKLEPELLDELGLFVRVDEATQKYATQMNKASGDLTNFERRQAFANEALQQATDKFGAIGGAVDTNAYAKLAAAVSDLSKDFLSLINTALVPVIEVLSKNPTALFAAIGIFGGKIIASAVANFGTFETAAEKATVSAAKLGISAGQTTARLNTTSVGMRNLGAALRTGNADTRLFAAGFDAINRSIAHYEGRLRSATITTQAYGERLRANTTIAYQFLAAKVALTLAAANESAQIALLQLQDGQYRDALVSTREAIKESTQALRESASKLMQNGTVSTIVAAVQRVLAGTTSMVTAAFTAASGAVSALTTRLMANLLVQRLVTAAQSIGSAVMLIFGTAAKIAGGGVLFLGSALLIALPLISLIALAATMAGDAFEWFMSLFRSDEENQLLEDLKETEQMFDELTKSTAEVNKYFEGQESKLTSLSQTYESLGNILSQIAGEYRDLSTNSAFQDAEKAEFLTTALKDNVKLQKALALEAGIEGKERIKSIKELQKAGITRQEAVKLGERALQNAKNEALANTALTKSIQEGKEAAMEFMNALTPRTNFDNILGVFEGMSSALKDAQEQALDTGEDVNNILKDNLQNSPELLIIMGVDPSYKVTLSNLDSDIKSSFDKIEEYAKEGDLTNMSAEMKNHEKLIRKRKEFVQVNKQNSTSLADRVVSTTKLLQIAQKESRQGKIDLKTKKQELEIEKTLNQNTESSLTKQQDLRDEINKQIRDSATNEADVYQQIVDGLPKTEENAARRLFLEAKITELRNKATIAGNKILTTAERALEVEQLNVKNVQDRQKLEKAVLAFQEKRVALVEKEMDALQKSQDAITGMRAALQNRDVTSEEQLSSETPGRKRNATETKELRDLLASAANIAYLNSRGAGASVAEATKLQSYIRKSAGTRLGDEIEAEMLKGKIREEKIRLEYDLLEAQYALLRAQVDVYREQKTISAESAETLASSIDGMIDGLGQQEQRAINANTATTSSNIVSIGAESISADARVEEERRIQVRDAMIQQGERMMAQDRVMQGLQVKRNAFEAERQVLAQRVADLKAEQKEGEEPSQALMQAEAALQANLNTQLQIRAEQIAALIEKAKGLSGGEIPGLESITAQTANEIVPEVPGAESGTPTAGTSATGADPSLSMEERVGQLRETAAQMTTVLGELGPEGAAMQTALNGAMTLADTFATAFDSIQDGGMSMQEGLQAAGAVVSALGAMQQAQAQAAVAGVDQQIAAEKKRDGKSKESLAKIAALEKKKEKIERKAFEKKKRAQMAGVIISTASAIMKEAEKGIPASLPGIAMAVALGAAQLSAISSQTYQGGSGGAPSGPSKVSVGNRQNTVDLARANSPSGELAYARNQAGVGTGMTNFTPTGAFGGMKYRANGGNTAFMVGEQGPELFVPETPGTILPSDETEAIAPVTNVNFSINAVDGASVEELLLTQRGNIIGMIREAANGSGETFLESVNVLSDQYQGVE